jgi:hypothetical protein
MALLVGVLPRNQCRLPLAFSDRLRQPARSLARKRK